MNTLEDDVVSLIPISMAHFADYLQIAKDCPHNWDFVPTKIESEADIKGYIQQAIDAKASGEELPYSIFSKEHQRIIGSTRFYNISHPHQTLLIGSTWLHDNFKGMSINKRAKFLLLQYAFESLNMARVGFNAGIKNERSIAAMKAIGATFEGVMRSDKLMPDGTRRDSAVLSILQSEWVSHVKADLQAKISEKTAKN